MLLADVSGRQKNHMTKTGPASQKISQSDHRQFSATTAKPDSMGPKAGAAKTADTHTDTEKGRYRREYWKCVSLANRRSSEAYHVLHCGITIGETRATKETLQKPQK